MDKKKIISSTVVFFITTSIVLLFSGIFGGENVLVGVQGTAAVLFLLIDYWFSCIYSFFKSLLSNNKYIFNDVLYILYFHLQYKKTCFSTIFISIHLYAL